MPLYDAFISYSHAKDKPVASALQSVIQRLGKPWYKRRALRVFRDDTSLSATPHLWPSIETALSQSRHLILLASPEASQSPWIAKEVDYWLTHKSADTLFVGLTDGDLAWDTKAGDFDWSGATPLPETLKGRFPDEPKWVDLRGTRDDPHARSVQMIELGADFAAAIHGVPKEDLLSQELRQQRKALTLATSAAAALLVLTLLATWQWYRADSALTAAAKAADTLVRNAAIAFRDIAGVPINRVQEILDQTLALQSELASIGGDRTDVQRNEALIHRELANTLVVKGDFEDALKHAQEARKITQQLVDDNPGNPDLQRDLSLSLNRLGEAQSKMGHHDEALTAFRESLAIRQALASAGEDEAQRDLAVSHERIGDTLRALKQTDAALDAFDKALAIRKTLAATDPENGQWQLDLAVSYDKKANHLLDAGDTDAALAEYRKALEIRQKLVEHDAVSARYARDLSSSYIRVGDALLKVGRSDEAVESFRKALEIRRTLAKDENNVNAQIDLVLSLVKAAGAGDDTLAHVTEANDIVQGLNAQAKLPAHQKDWVVKLEEWKQSLVP